MNRCSVNATVTDTDGRNAVMLTEPAAEECSACGSAFCGVRRGHTVKIPITGATVGDKFLLQLPGRSITFISFWLYVAGVLAALLTAYLAKGGGDLISAVVFLITIALWIPLCTWRLGVYAKKQIKIIKL